MTVETGDRYANLEDLELAHVKLLEDFDRTCTSETIVSDSESERRFVEANRDRIVQLISKGALTGIVLHGLAERRPAQQILDRWASLLFRVGIRDAPRATLAQFDENAAPDLVGKPSPYVGLEPFREGEAPQFFGREDRVDALVEAVRTRTFVFVTGASGSGKSSLVLAGLIPALRKNVFDGSDRWKIVPTIVPGSTPLRNLVTQLCAIFATLDKDQLYEQLRNDPQRLRAVLDEQAPTTCLIVVDQFEEVFTLRTAAADNDSPPFIAALAALAGSPECRHRIVATFRKDREGYLASNAELRQIYFDQPFIVSSMTPDQLREAIVKPAAEAGLIIEDDVVETLVNTFTSDETGLPLLQYCLVELWQRRTRNRVTRRTLRELGDPKHAMAQVTDEIYNSLAVERQAAVKLIFLALAQKVEGQEFLRTRKTRAELWSIVGNKVTADDIIERFAERRLLKVSPAADHRAENDTIEVAHEALLRNWTEFRKWVVEEGTRLDQRSFIAHQAALWADCPGKEQADTEDQDSTGLLLSGIALRQAMADIYNDFPEQSVERRFLDASDRKSRWVEGELQRAAEAAQNEAAWAREKAKSERRKNNWLFVALAIILTLLGGVAWLLNDVDIKRKQFLAQHVGGAARTVCETDPELARKLARRAFEIGSLDQAATVKDAIAASFCLVRAPTARLTVTNIAKGSGASAFAVAPNGGAIIAGYGSGAIQEWQVSGDGVRLSDAFGAETEKQGAFPMSISSLAYSPDTNFVLVGSGGTGDRNVGSGGYCAGGNQCGSITLLSRRSLTDANGAAQSTPDNVIASLDTGTVSQVAFSRDGSHIAVVSVVPGMDVAPAGGQNPSTILQIWERAEVIKRRAFGNPKFRDTIEAGVARLTPGPGPDAFMAATQTNRVFQVRRVGDRYVVAPIRNRCETQSSIAAGKERQVVARASKTCVFGLSGGSEPIFLEEDNVLHATLRGDGDNDNRLILLSATQDGSADLVIRDLNRTEDPVIQRKAVDLTDMSECRDAPAGIATTRCGDFNTVIQSSLDGKTIAIKPTSKSAINVYRVVPDSDRLKWLRHRRTEVVFSSDDRYFGVLYPLPHAEGRYTYKAYESDTGRKVHDVEFELRDQNDRPVLALIDRTGTQFALQDKNGTTWTKVFRVSGKSAELALDVKAGAVLYPARGMFGMIQREPKTNSPTSCELYRIDDPAKPVWSIAQGLLACQFSDDAKLAIVSTEKDGALSLSVQSTETAAPTSAEPIPNLPQDMDFYLFGTDTKYLAVATPVPGSGSDSRVVIYAWRNGKLAKASEYVGPTPVDTGGASPVFALAESGSAFLVVEGDGVIALRGIEKPDQGQRLSAHTLDPSGRFAVADGGGKTSIFRVDSPDASQEVIAGSRVIFSPKRDLAYAARGSRVVLHDLAKRAAVTEVPFPVQGSNFSTAGNYFVVRTAESTYVLPLQFARLDDLIAFGERRVELTDAEKCTHENDASACSKRTKANP